MDGDWFRLQHKLRGISQTQLAARMGRSPTFLTRVYSGAQPLKVSEAGDLARLLGLELREVLARAGLAVQADQAPGEIRPRGFEESDVQPLQGVAPAPPPLRAQGNGQTVWTVHNDGMALAGFLPGDQMIVDANATPHRGDAVIAQIYDWRAETAQTVLRLYLPPYLTRPSVRAEAPLTVDGEHVIIKGTVVASWRVRPPEPGTVIR